MLFRSSPLCELFSKTPSSQFATLFTSALHPLFTDVKSIGRLHKFIDKLYKDIYALNSSTVVVGDNKVKSQEKNLIFEKDFVKWNNPYNPIISTTGNPNFASALYAILATIIIFNLLCQKNKMFITLQLILVILLIRNILVSDSRQGLVSLFFGCGAGFVILAAQYLKKIAPIILTLFVTLGGLIVFGMLRIGPLTSLVYKESVSIRGYYWRAGLQMAKDHLIFGVGIDSYGSFFKQYVESTYLLKYGYQITSTNAHSVPIQILSTGGVFVFIFYSCLILLTLFLSSKYGLFFSN